MVHFPRYEIPSLFLGRKVFESREREREREKISWRKRGGITVLILSYLASNTTNLYNMDFVRGKEPVKKK